MEGPGPSRVPSEGNKNKLDGSLHGRFILPVITGVMRQIWGPMGHRPGSNTYPTSIFWDSTYHPTTCLHGALRLKHCLCKASAVFQDFARLVTLCSGLGTGLAAGASPADHALWVRTGGPGRRGAGTFPRSWWASTALGHRTVRFCLWSPDLRPAAWRCCSSQ